MARSVNKPATAEAVSLAGLTSQEIAALIASGEITQKYAEEFVSERAIRKLQRAIESQDS